MWVSDQEILEKAIEKAIANGYKDQYLSVCDVMGDGNWLYQVGGQAKNMEGIWYGQSQAIEKLIFSKDFAKALWGEETRYEPVAGGELYPNWKYHLQCMVVAEDPIKYLGENIG